MNQFPTYIEFLNESNVNSDKEWVDIKNTLKDLGYSSFMLWDKDMEEIKNNFKDATHFSIMCDDMGEPLGISFIPLPSKKKINVDWFLEKINKKQNNTYVNFAKHFEIILKKKMKGLGCYATTYGLGIYSLFGKDVTKQQAEIGEILNQYEISFRCEYSLARWVFRYIISKSKPNLINMQKLIDDN